MKKSHFTSIKRALQLLLLIHTLVSALILTAPASILALPLTPPLRPCDKQESIQIPLSDSWQRATTTHPQAVCVFRSKDVGFPTLTVVQTTPPLPAEIRSKRAKLDYLEKSYRLVGITDARAENLLDLTRPNLHGYSAVMSFTTSVGATKALVSVYELPDRNYILTLQDRAESFEATKGALYAIAEGVQIAAGIDGIPQPSSSPLKADWAWWAVLALVVAVLLVGTSLWIIRAQRP